MTVPKIRLSTDLALPLEVVTESIAILAKRRVGKSYTGRVVAEELYTAGQQFVIVDPKGDWWGIRSSADGKKPGLPIVIMGGEHGDVPIEVGSGELVAKLLVEQRVSMLIDLSSFRKSEVKLFMATFLETLYRLKARDEYRTALMVIVDEADAIAPQRPDDGEQRMLGAIEDLVRRGGQRGIGVMLISQRAAVLNKNVLTQCGILILLRTMGSQDIEAVDTWIKKHGRPEERAIVMKDLASLPLGTAQVWAPGWPDDAGIFQRVKIRPIATFDSGATPKPGEARKAPKTLADVNLVAFRAEMATTIEQVKANDPRELKKRIAELEREKSKSVPISAPAKIEVKTVEKPVVRPEEIAGIEKILAQVTAERDVVTKRWDVLLHSVSALLGAAQQVNATAKAASVPPRPLAREMAPVSRRTPTASAPIGGRAGTPTADDAPTPARQRILNALRWFESIGTSIVTRPQLAFLAGASPKSSAFQNNLGAMRSAGWIDYDAAARVFFKPAGRELAEDAPDLLTNGELHDAICRKLVPAQQRLLRALIQAHPAALSRDDLGDQVGASVGSSAFQNNLGFLRGLGLIDYPDRGSVVATAQLFPEDR